MSSTRQPPRRAHTVAAASLLALLLAGCKDTTIVQSEDNPLPVLLGVAPEQIVFGTTDTLVALHGEGFVRGSRVRLGEQDRATTYVNDTLLRVRVDSADRAAPRLLQYVVVNPAPGGGTSGVKALVVGWPLPTIATVTPSELVAGAATTAVVITGTGFGPGTTVQLDQEYLWPDTVQATRIALRIPAQLLADGGTRQLRVTNPSPGGGPSAPATFAIRSPVPVLSGITPDTAYTGSGFTLTVTGSGFTSASSIRWNGAARATTRVSSSRLTTTISAADAAAAATVTIDVVTAAPGGGTSASRTLRLREAPPRITSLSPSTVTVGAPTQVVTIGGANFTASSVVHLDGTPRTTTFVSATQLRVTVPSADLAVEATPQLTVVNPGSSGSSLAAALPVLPATVGLGAARLVDLRTNHVVYDSTLPGTDT